MNITKIWTLKILAIYVQLRMGGVWGRKKLISRQITTSTPHHSVFTGRMLFLTPDQQCQRTQGNTAETQYYYIDTATCDVGLISGSLYLSRCNKIPQFGLYIWTAGYRQSSQAPHFTWQWPSARWQIQRGSRNTRMPVTFTFWHREQPDNQRGIENCVNIWPNKNYRWNDQRCDSRFCFVCENRNAPA